MINGLNKIVASIGLAITTSVVTFATINAKTKSRDVDQINDNIIENNEKLKDNNKYKSKIDYDSDEDYLKKTNSIIDSCITRLSQWRQVNGIPGLVVGVSLRGRNIWIYPEGFANIENNVKCNDETVMRIASISKSMTASLLAKLMQEKKIDIDLPISQYLTKEQFPDKFWEGKKVDITVRQLASHLGGIRHYKSEQKETDTNASKASDSKTSDSKTSNSKNENNNSILNQLGEFSNKEYYLKQRFETVTESLKLFKDDPLVAKPGTKYFYTTYGWTLISAVIETQLNGEPFEKHLIKFLREKLGMNYTYLDQNDPIIYNRSSYYMKTGNGQLINAPYVDNSYKWAGGGLLANVYDLLRFGNIMLYSYKGGTSDGKKGFFSQEVVQQMWTPAENTKKDWFGYGIGWVTVKDAKSEYAFCAEPLFPNLFSHTGGAVGASSVLLIEPKHELVVTIITNLQNTSGIYKAALDIVQEFTKDNITHQQLAKMLSQIKSNSLTDGKNENEEKP